MLQVKNISFSYDEAIILNAVDFEIRPGEHVAVMGESGCGKSTLLKIIYGLLPLESGKIFWKGNEARGPLYNLVPGEPFMKYLSQDFDLMPFTTVRENIAQYLSVFYPDEQEKRTKELLDLTELDAFADIKVKNLSGGQQQRVALGRVLAQKPELLLLDEPFSHIDNFRKNSLRRNLFDYLKNEGITWLTATHDYHDVLPFADRVIVLKDKQLVADEPILSLYRRPRELYIASLFGEANLVPINVLKSYADTTRRIIVYAHEFRISDSSGLPVVVQTSYYMGSHYLIKSLAGNDVIYFHSPTSYELGKNIFLNIAIETINKRMIH
ncbi:MAG: ABC transporter ATP-binding protein [Flavobacteriaceae bacterium]